VKKADVADASAPSNVGAAYDQLCTSYRAIEDDQRYGGGTTAIAAWTENFHHNVITPPQATPTAIDASNATNLAEASTLPTLPDRSGPT
jgi:hypothetical protein